MAANLGRTDKPAAGTFESVRKSKFSKEEKAFTKGAKSSGGKQRVNLVMEDEDVHEIELIRQKMKLPSRNALLMKWIGEGMERDK